MADTRASVTIDNLRAEDVALKRHEGRPAVYLELGSLVYVTLGLDAGDEALEAAAMRKLSEVAAEAAAELDHRAAEREDGRDE
jgi:hypothetical protein